MEARLLVIKKILDALDIPATVQTVAERIMVQKAIYLAQRAGIRLGYTYGWYIRGPYSPRLTRDYFEMQDALAVSGPDVEKASLKQAAADKMERLSPLLDPPDEFTLAKHRWLELVASLDYLRNFESKSDREAASLLETRKPRLYPFIRLAQQRLAEFAPLFS